MKSPIYYLGDIHGAFVWLMSYIEKSGIQQCTIIAVGDFATFKTYSLAVKKIKELNIFLAKHGITLYSIRGNHDNPKLYTGEFKLSNLKLLPDYSNFFIQDKKYLFVGGAVSVDRIRQKEKNSYFTGEEFFYDEQKLCGKNETIKNIDIVISHIKPSFAYPQYHTDFVKNCIKADSELKEDLATERRDIDKLWYKLCETKRPEKWIYGHYHRSNFDDILGTEFHLLGINELKEIR